MYKVETEWKFILCFTCYRILIHRISKNVKIRILSNNKSAPTPCLHNDQRRRRCTFIHHSTNEHTFKLHKLCFAKSLWLFQFQNKLSGENLVRDVTAYQLLVTGQGTLKALLNWLPPQNTAQAITGQFMENVIHFYILCQTIHISSRGKYCGILYSNNNIIR